MYYATNHSVCGKRQRRRQNPNKKRKLFPCITNAAINQHYERKKRKNETKQTQTNVNEGDTIVTFHTYNKWGVVEQRLSGCANAFSCCQLYFYDNFYCFFTLFLFEHHSGVCFAFKLLLGTPPLSFFLSSPFMDVQSMKTSIKMHIFVYIYRTNTIQDTFNVLNQNFFKNNPKF